MRLNTLTPPSGSRRPRKRVGRGIGSGTGKTAGRGHKGQKSRSGGYHKTGFEGGQMPLQRRLPKSGFRSHRPLCAEVGTGRLESLDEPTVTLDSLRSAGLVPGHAVRAKIMLRGELTRAYAVQGIAVTRGARAAIEAAGGEIQE